MRGHEQLINMRLSGLVPEAIFLCDFPTATDWALTGDQPTICVAGDSISSMDLRFVTGLMVHISGDDPKRAKALMLACKQHKARIIGAVAGSYQEIYAQA